MRPLIAWFGRAGWPAAVSIMAIVLWLAYATTANGPILGQPPVRPALQIVAMAITGLLLVLVGGRLILAMVSSEDHAPTALQRAVMYALLSFAGLCAALAWLGYDLRTVLATSAIGSAIVGFAMQPTLGSVISGMALNVDHTITVGDGLVIGSDTIQVVSLNWRNVHGYKPNGALVVIPNAKLADQELQVMPRARPVRAQVAIQAPAAVTPQRVSDLVTELISDLPQLDLNHSILVLPVEHELTGDTSRYWLRYWVTDYADLEAVEAEVLRRLWYGFRRYRLAGVETDGANSAGELTAEGIAALLRVAAPDMSSATATMVAQSGECLLFAPDERLIVPERYEGWRFLLLRGKCVAAPGLRAPRIEGAPLHRLDQLGRGAAVRYLVAALANHIGPYAEFAVSRLSRTSQDLNALCRNVANEIPDTSAREKFLSEMSPEQEAAFPAGLMLHAQQDAAGALVLQPSVKAVDEALVIAIPSSAPLERAAVAD
ncbi:MAG: mechanosensitive ion channel [Acetobacteraceae bacterium]|nr:mechanosensitive ion channel [Acetobacteraceae bacterium]